jgi:hypothetical protein
MIKVVKKVSELRTTKLSASILQVLVLTLFLKDVKRSDKVTELAMELLQ